MKKVLIVIYKIICFIIALFIILFQRLISPLILVRISYFDSARIGNLYPYYWTYRQGVTFRLRLNLDIFLSSKAIANNEWHNMFKKKFLIVKHSYLTERLLNLINRLPNKQKYTYTPVNRLQLYNNQTIINNIILNKQPFFELNEQQISKGIEQLTKLGLREKNPFICFHNRDSSYLEQTYPDRNWGYHDYRDSSISNYLKAVEYLVDCGFYAIRTGAKVKEKVNSTNPQIIEYADSPNRDEFMDLFLGSQCKLFLCSDTGMSIIPELFDIPCVYTNWVPILSISNWVKRGIYIPKRFYSHRLKRDLTFIEILSDPKLSFQAETGYFTKNEIELIENTPEEIYDATREMMLILNNEWNPCEESNELLVKYLSLNHMAKFKSKDFNISLTYLKKNQHLLAVPS